MSIFARPRIFSQILPSGCHSAKTAVLSSVLSKPIRQHSKQKQTGKMGRIERITMFKIPKEEDRNRALEQYRVLKRTAVKVCMINDNRVKFPWPAGCFSLAGQSRDLSTAMRCFSQSLLRGLNLKAMNLWF
jgi:hypothetical protein